MRFFWGLFQFENAILQASVLRLDNRMTFKKSWWWGLSPATDEKLPQWLYLLAHDFENIPLSSDLQCNTVASSQGNGTLCSVGKLLPRLMHGNQVTFNYKTMGADQLLNGQHCMKLLCASKLNQSWCVVNGTFCNIYLKIWTILLKPHCV